MNSAYIKMLKENLQWLELDAASTIKEIELRKANLKEAKKQIKHIKELIKLGMEG